MNAVTLRRISIVGAILTVLVAIDGLYMTFANYHPDDTSNNGFGSFHPSDGQTVLIAALLLLIVSVLAFVLSTRATQTATPVAAQQEETTETNTPAEPQEEKATETNTPAASDNAASLEPEVEA